ncbi:MULTISPECIES: hypothetical protein [Nocardioides]|uniref:Discoidin domain-containing protein n=1 Tax=Nocardioides vastitatis TaxID=2568655 RepID=A0ABW0ZF50_9ACTN|nr:hypothetical protein [Nocardioides sp.]THJ03325.1 hypothetical protein E7Z54_09680 [Nocardioides sp.]
MTRSTIRRLAGGVAATALAVTTLAAAGAAPAQASSCTTQTTIQVNGNAANKTVTYGQSASIWAQTVITGCDDTTAGNGKRPPGTLVIQRSADGRSWSTLATGADSHATYFGPIPRTVFYRAVHNGSTYASHTFGRSSDSLRVAVKRYVKVVDRSTSRRSVGVFKIRPAASIRGMRAVFQVRRNGAWRSYKRVLVPRTGNVRATFANSRRGIKYRMVLPSARGFVKASYGPFVARRY